VTKYLSKSILKEKRFTLAHSFEVSVCGHWAYVEAEHHDRAHMPEQKC
jgi:hypothetical protein